MKKKRKVMLHYIIRNHNKFISVGIALTVMLIFSLVQIGESISLQYKNLLVGTSNYDIGINAVSSEEEKFLMEYIQNHDEITQYGYEDDILQVSIPKHPEYSFAFLSVYQEGHPFPSGDIIMKKGEVPKQAFEVALDEKVYEALGVTLGSVITLPLTNAEGKSISCKVTGVYQPLSVPEDYGDSTWILVSKETKNTLFEQKTKMMSDGSSMTLMLKKNKFDEVKIDNIVEEVRSLFNKDYQELQEKVKNGIKMSKKESAQYEKIQEKVFINTGKMEALSEKGEGNQKFIIMIVMAVVVAFSIFLLVYNSVNLLVVKRIKDYSTLRCIGMNKKQLHWMLWAEMTVYGLSGIAIGILMGNILNHLVANKIISLICNMESSLIQSPYSYLIAVMISIVAILAANAQMLIKIRKMSPIEGLYYTEKITTKGKVQHKRKKIRSMVSTLSSRNVMRNISKSVAVIVSLMVCTVLMIVIIHFVFSMKDMLSEEKTYKQEISQYETYIDTATVTYNNPEADAKQYVYADGVYQMPEIIQKIYRFNDYSYFVNDAVKGDYMSWAGNIILCDNALLEQMQTSVPELKDIDVKKDVLIYVSFESYAVETKEVEGNKIQMENNCYINAEGYVTLELTKGDVKKKKKLKVVQTISGFRLTENTSGSQENGYFIMNEVLAKKIYGNTGYNHILFVTEKESAEVKNALKEQYVNGIEGAVFSDYKMGNEEERKMLVGFACLLVYLVVATALVGFSNMSNTIQANILSRRKENGVLRALGMSKKMQEKVILLENMKLVTATAMTSAICSFLINTVIIMGVFGEFHVYLSAYFLIGILLYLTSYLVTKRAIYCSNKNTIVENLRQED